jgi:hypothetical protein
MSSTIPVDSNTLIAIAIESAIESIFKCTIKSRSIRIEHRCFSQGDRAMAPRSLATMFDEFIKLDSEEGMREAPPNLPIQSFFDNASHRVTFDHCILSLSVRPLNMSSPASTT